MNEKKQSKFAIILRRERDKRDMTLEQMAEFLGTTKQVLSRYERGERSPKLTTAAEFANRLGIPIESFQEESNDGSQSSYVAYREEIIDSLVSKYMLLSDSEKDKALDYLNYLVEQSKKNQRLPGIRKKDS